ncbi:outer membrane protein [Vibrio rarus]|uniref:outer membrane protein n=1 Tax=Vibrio rarus TaxID=413403 RepID=UPI0021C443AA|nr:porin family protein [Vibrio rarus]
MKKHNLIALCSLALLSSSAFASSDQSGFYVLGAVGTTGMDDGGYTEDAEDTVRLNGNDPYFKTELEGKGVTKLYSAGYQINRIVGIEATYTDYGHINARTHHDSVKVFDPESFSVSANLGYSFHNGLRPFAKIGLSYVDLGQDDSQNSAIKNPNKLGGVHVGAGVEYALDLGENNGNLLFRTGVEGDIVNAEMKQKSPNNFYDDNYSWSLATLYAGVGYRF